MWANTHHCEAAGLDSPVGPNHQTHRSKWPGHKATEAMLMKRKNYKYKKQISFFRFDLIVEMHAGVEISLSIPQIFSAHKHRENLMGLCPHLIYICSQNWIKEKKNLKVQISQSDFIRTCLSKNWTKIVTSGIINYSGRELPSQEKSNRKRNCAKIKSSKKVIPAKIKKELRTKKPT